MLFFIIGTYFIWYLKKILLSLKERKKKGINIHIIVLLYEWMLTEHVEEKYYIKTSKFFITSLDFRLLTIDVTMLMFDFIFLYPSIFINTLFLILVLLVMFLCIVFKMFNDYIYFGNKTKNLYFLKFKLFLLKLYFYIITCCYFAHVFFSFTKDINVIQEVLIKFIFLYFYIYYIC